MSRESTQRSIGWTDADRTNIQRKDIVDQIVHTKSFERKPYRKIRKRDTDRTNDTRIRNRTIRENSELERGKPDDQTKEHRTITEWTPNDQSYGDQRKRKRERCNEREERRDKRTLSTERKGAPNGPDRAQKQRV